MDKILTLHPQGKSGVNIDKLKYEQVKAALLASLKNGPLSLTELFTSIDTQIGTTFDGKIGWYSHAVKQDLEARKLIERTNDKPQKYKIVTVSE